MEGAREPEPEELFAEELLRKNLAAVRGRIAAAALRAGRDPEGVALVGVTKYVGPDVAGLLVGLGLEDLGESRLPALEAKVSALGAHPPTWHFVGPLQRNKARRCLLAASWIHSVESERLLLHLDRIAGEEGVRPRILLEVDLTGEKGRHGVPPAGLGELLDQAREAQNLALQGLMTLAPFTEDLELAASTFRRLRRLLQEYAPDLPHLSMGMSHDLEPAVAEGATLVRVGSDLFSGISLAARDE